MNCDKCGCEGRVAHVDEQADGAAMQYTCANPACGNFRRIFAERWIAKKAD